MHVGEFLFYNTYIPQEIRSIVDQYYSVQQANENTIFNKNFSANDPDKNSKIDRRDVLINYLINDDVQLSANTSYMNLSEFFDMNAISSLVDKAVIAEGGITGNVASSHASYKNIFNYSMWEKTEPMNINIKIVLYSKTDPFIDVVIPAYLLMSHAGLDKIPSVGNEGSKFAVPGVSAMMALYMYNKQKFKVENNILDTAPSGSTFNKTNVKDTFVYDEYTRKNINGKDEKYKVYNKSNSLFNSKLFSFLINGLIFIDKAYIKSINATFSKHTAKTSFKSSTSSSVFQGNYPIWAELDVNVESITPATSDMLWDSLTSKGANILANSGT